MPEENVATATPTQAAAAPVTEVTPPVPEVRSPVSNVKPSIISDAGKTPAPEASKDGKSIIDGAKAEGQEVAKEGEVKKEEAPVKGIVPEKYEIKAPEGLTIDEAVLAEFTPIAKELGLSNEQAQKLADFQAGQIVKSQAAQKAAFEKYVETTQKEATDFFGSKLEEILPYVAKGRDNYADDEVMQLLEATGLSNHKAFIRMFDKMGRSVSEDKLVEGKPAAPTEQRTDGQIIYGKDK